MLAERPANTFDARREILNRRPMKNWDNLRKWLQGVLLPAVLALTGYLFGKSNAAHDEDVRMVEIAARILVNDSTSARATREWARKVIALHSHMPFGDWPGGRRAFIGLSLCDSAGNNCQTQVLSPLDRPTPLQTVRIVVSPVTVTLLPTQVVEFVAVGLTDAGDTALISDLTWTASGGSIADTIANGGRHYAHFMAGTATGDFLIVARSASASLADSARVHVQAR